MSTPSKISLYPCEKSILVGSKLTLVLVAREDDKNWPEPNKVGRQELEIIIGDKHKPFSTSKFGSYAEV